MEAVVYKIHSDFYYVKPKNSSDGLLECKLREVLKKQKLKIKVGDFVEIENNNVIKALLKRENTLSRPAVSNLDLVVVVSSLKEPELDFIQLNRYLIFLKYHKIPVLLCFNKDDLLTKEELDEKKSEIERIYGSIGYKAVFTSALLKEGMGEFKNFIQDKTIAFCGLSGVGKSSILNALTDTNLRTGNVSNKTKRGCHTTRHSEIIEFEGIKIIDTPGFSKLTFDFILPKDLSDLFDDIKKFKNECKFKDCLHTKNDEECSVIKNLDKIPNTRYESYLEFLRETFDFKQKVTYESQKKESNVKVHLERNFTKISEKKRSFSRKKQKQQIKNFNIESENDD